MSNSKKKQMALASWKCTLLHLPCSASLFGEERNSNTHPSTVFSSSCSLCDFWPIMGLENWAEKSTVLLYYKKFNSRAHSHHKTELPDMLQAMAVLWENACAVGQYFKDNWVRFNTYPVFYNKCKVHGPHWPSPCIVSNTLGNFL